MEELIARILPTVIGGLFNLASNWIGGISGSSSSSMNQSSTSTTVGSNQTNTSTSQIGGQSGTETTTGSISGVADVLKTAMSTATGNNAATAGQFNLGSATTANNLQENLWNQGNLLSMGSNLLANAMSAQSTASARAYNSAEAEKQRQWQDHMSSTSYQRGVEDLKAAGLNPILAAYNGFGAGSAPSGGYGSVSGGQTFSQANIASAPSMHTASMQAMYDYGNNTAQFLNNAMQTINNAHQVKEYSVENWMRNIMESVGSSSARTVSDITSQTRTDQSMQKTTPEVKVPGAGRGDTTGGTTHGGGGGRGK